MGEVLKSSASLCMPKERHHTKLGHETCSQLTGHTNYFIYSSLVGTKGKISSPKAVYSIYLGIYNTPFYREVGGFVLTQETLCI